MIARALFFFASVAVLSSAACIAQETIHILKKGETLYSVSRTYGVSFSAIAKANNIADADKVRIGQKLIIPGTGGAPKSAAAAEKHTVKKGETLFGIARQYGLTVSELRAFNGLSDKTVIKPGDLLAVARAPQPKVEAAPAPVQETAAKSGGTDDRAEGDPRPVTAKRNDPKIRWPVQAKELAYMEGKLYGVLLTGERAEPVESLSSGTVVSADAYRGFGRVAIVQSPNGHVYVYGGNESLSVKSGDKVAAGTELGRLGIDSLTGKPSLFFFVYKDNVAIDPAKAPRS